VTAPASRRARVRSVLVAGSVAILGGLAFGACGSAPPPRVASTSPDGSDALATALPSNPASAMSSSAVEVDASLLDILPDAIDGVPIAPEAETAEGLAADPTLAGDVSALALAIAVDADAGGQNLAIVNVVRVRSSPIGGEFFRQWRDSYDEAACASAGGLTGHAEAEMGGRQVFIGSCSGGAFTYHTIHSGEVIVSITSVGERRLGEAIVSGLKD